MAVIIIRDKVTSGDLKIASQEYGDYVKIVVDIRTQAMGIGGEWHADIEKELLSLGSTQRELWGGGIDVTTQKIDYTSLINIRPSVNDSMEILNPEIKDVFRKIVFDRFNV